jgi:hypothetical protein
VLSTVLANFSTFPELASPDAVMRRIGSMLSEVQRLSPQSFDELTWNAYSAMRSQSIQECEKCLASYRHQPDYWARDLTAYIHGLQTIDPPGWKFSDLPPPADGPLGARIIGRFGDLISAWSEIRACAVELQQTGIGFGVDVL